MHATLPQFLAASMRIIAQAPDEQEAARRIAAMGPLGGQLASGPSRRSSVAAQIPVREWPRQRLLIAAVDAESGRRVAFGAGSGVRLLDAVTASGALPGIYPLVRDQRAAVRRRRGAFAVQRRPRGRPRRRDRAQPDTAQRLPAGHARRRDHGARPGDRPRRAADKESLAAIGPDALSARTAQAALERRRSPGPPGDQRAASDMALACQPRCLTGTLRDAGHARGSRYAP